MWGLVFVGPLLLPEYPATLQSFGRYLAFGLIALPLAWFDRNTLRQLTRADWREALRLALVGNVVYYLFLASAIQRAGGPLPTMIIGTLPVVIAITANLRGHRAGTRVEQPLRWAQLAALAGADRAGHRAGQPCRDRAPEGRARRRPRPLRARRRAGGGRRGLLDLVPDPQRRMAARPPRPQPARLGHRAGPGHAAAGAGRLRADLGLVRAVRSALRDALRPARGRLPGADVRHRPARVVARHAVLERGQPAPAADASPAS